MPDCPTIIDGPQSGVWNMAVDEVLLERAAADKNPRLRLYAWHPATLSLGYFQRAADRQAHAPSLACPLVRRSSGGGAILHDREITYCLAVPGERIDGPALYRRVHAAMVEMLGGLGVKAQLVADAEPRSAAAAFLCFQRRATGDVIVEGNKVIGSAQRRRRGALVQHGSILLQASPAAPELPGLVDLMPSRFEHVEWLAQVQRALAKAIDCSLNEAPLTTAEIAHAERLAKSKYTSASWNEMR